MQYSLWLICIRRLVKIATPAFDDYILSVCPQWLRPQAALFEMMQQPAGVYSLGTSSNRVLFRHLPLC